MATRGIKRMNLALKSSSVTVYTSASTANALREIMEDSTLYKGVRLVQILEAVYAQGRKDGARAALEGFEARLDDLKKEIPHKNPGRPRKAASSSTTSGKASKKTRRKRRKRARARRPLQR